MVSPRQPREPRQPRQQLNNDLQRLIEQGQQARSARLARDATQQILQGSRQVGDDSIERLRNEDLLRQFNEGLNATLGTLPIATAPQEEGPVGVFGTILGGLGRLQDVTEGLAGFGTELVQKVIPGEQTAEREVRRLRAEGAGVFEAREKAFEAQDLPSVRVDITPGFAIPLPFGRKLDEIDLGVKGAIELVADPINLALAIGTGGLALAGKQGAKAAISSALRSAGVPGTQKWMQAAKRSPQSAEHMARYTGWLEDGVTPSIGEVASPPPVKGTKYDQFLAREEAAEVAKPPSSSLRKRAEEQFTDEFAEINAATRRAKNETIKLGVPFDDKINAELTAALLKGAVSGGVNKAQLVVRRSLQTLGKGIDSKHLSAYLRLRHLVDVHKMHPSRVLPKPFETVEQVTEAIDDMRKLIGEQQFVKVEAAARVVAKGYQEMLEQQVRSGLVADAVARELRRDYPFYNPIRYISTTENVLDGSQDAFKTSGRSINVTRPDLQRLSEVGIDAVTEDPLETIYHAFGRSELTAKRNDAARALIGTLSLDPQSRRILRRVREGEKVKGPTISTMVAGEKRVYAVPQWAEREAKQFAISEFGSLERIARGINALPRALLVNYNPAFLAANFIFDSMTVAVTKGVMPWSTANAALKNLRAILKNDDTLNKMMQAGGDVSGFWGRDVQDQIRAINRSGNLGVRTEREWLRFLSRPWETFREVAHSLELGPRRAVFESAIRRGKTDKQAALWARRSTVDFQRAGRAVRTANSYFLFLNPAIQGSMLPFRAAFTSDDRIRAIIGLSGLIGANAGAFAWNSQFEEYKDIPAFDRLGKLIVMLPSEEKDARGKTVPHYIAIVPMLREFTAITAPVNHILERIQGESPETFSELMGAIYDQANPVEPVTRLPVPTYIGQALTELRLNRDTFRDREIVPTELQGLPAHQQFNERTSEMAIRLGQWLGYSPMKIDHLVRSGLGQDIIALADMTIRDSLGENVQAQAVVAQLNEMRDYVSDDEYRRLRNTVLADLDADLRRAVEVEERRPEPDIPIATTVVNRFYRRYGGNLYRAGLEKAARENNITTEQVQAANNIMHQVDIELQDSQIQRDAQLDDGSITGKQWREARQDSSVLYQGVLMALGVQMPPLRNFLNDPVIRSEFYTKVNTLSGLFPDKRDKAQLLNAAFSAIPVPEIAPGVEDWQSFFQMRASFLANLSQSDRALLNEERRDSMTEEERRFDDLAGIDGLAAAYWNAPQYVLGDPALATDFRVFESLGGAQREQMARQRPELARAAAAISQTRDNLRLVSPELDAFLLRYGYTTTAMNPQNIGREIEIAPWLVHALQQLQPS